MRFHAATPLRWADLDAYGHVNNVEILRLLEEARVKAFWVADDPGERGESPAAAVIDAKLGSDTLSIISRTEIEYLKTIDYRRAPLDIQVWISKLGGANLQVCYEVWSPLGAEPAELYARAVTDVVLVDSETMKPRRMRDYERAAWTPYLEDAPMFSRR